MIHPHTRLEYINTEVGHGVIATQFIPAGTITYIEDDLDIKLSPDHPLLQNPDYSEIIEHFSFIDASGTRIISWDHAKFVNHCCNFNTISTGYGFEIAVRDIQPGEEITDEYGIFNMEGEMELRCSKGNCRNILKEDDFEQYYQRWDWQIIEAINKLPNVMQPLLKYMDEETKTDLSEFLETGENYKSVFSLKYQKYRKVPKAG